MTMNANVAEKKFVCNLCPKSFQKGSKLIRHLRIHNGDRPHRCDVCQKGFAFAFDLRTHRRIHTGEKPYTCDLCGRAFAVSCHLRRHARTHTGERPFSCGECGQAFARPSDLREHARVHTQERPFACGVCGGNFSRHSSLRRHLRTHTGETRHRCHLCGRGFSQSSNLKRHLQSHANGRVIARPASSSGLVPPRSPDGDSLAEPDEEAIQTDEIPGCSEMILPGSPDGGGPEESDDGGRLLTEDIARGSSEVILPETPHDDCLAELVNQGIQVDEISGCSERILSESLDDGSLEEPDGVGGFEADDTPKETSEVILPRTPGDYGVDEPVDQGIQPNEILRYSELILPGSPLHDGSKESDNDQGYQAEDIPRGSSEFILPGTSEDNGLVEPHIPGIHADKIPGCSELILPGPPFDGGFKELGGDHRIQMEKITPSTGTITPDVDSGGCQGVS